MSSTSFEGAWRRHDDFELPDEQPNRCEYAQPFSDWFERLYVDVAREASIVKINQDKVLLLDKYMEWRAFAPKRHRNYAGGGHTCLFHVFEASYNRLKTLELALTPPLLFMPPEPSRALVVPPPQIAGIFLGEQDEPYGVEDDEG